MLENCGFKVLNVVNVHDWWGSLFQSFMVSEKKELE